jgi:hypothetical protein
MAEPWTSNPGRASSKGLDDARHGAASAPGSPACPATRKFDPTHKANEAEFCSAYARGYAMGYSDGYVNQAKPAATRAEVQSK